MHLYSLTLQQATAINKAIIGNFSGTKVQEIIVAKGKYLEVLRTDESTGKLQVILSQEVFGLIRSMIPFRLPQTTKDYIIIGSDSGRVVILQYDNEKNSFIKVHQETFGKTGCRRIVPGQYLAADPKGRAFMIGAIEKQKFVYILNRDQSAKMTISSPLDAHKSHTLIFDICGVDVGYENPLFACLEVDYGDIDEEDSAVNTGKIEKMLIYYELDLGANNMIRKSADAVDTTANLLISVPGDPEGPGGVMICCENFLVYKTLSGQERKVYFPKRKGEEGKPIMINTFFTHKQKDFFFFLLQSELGDLYKVTLDYTEEEVHNIRIQYFDTIPVCVSLAVLKSGYLFAPAEFGNHGLYNFQSIGDDEMLPIITDSIMSENQIASFIPRQLRNLALVDEISNLSCITDLKVDDLTGEGNPQIYALCAAHHRSSLRVLRHGLAVTELAVSPLPAKAAAIWTIKGSSADNFDKYIVISFLNATLVLSIGEKVVEVSDSGLDSSKGTLHIGLLEDDAIIQVMSTGIRHIRKDKRINQWNTEGRIVKASSNPKQVVIALAGGEVIYFEVDSVGNLTEMEKMSLESEVVSLDIGAIPEGRQITKFLAVGLSDHSVRIFSLEPESCLQRLSAQALPAQPESVLLLEMRASSLEEETSGATSQLFLHVGLNNGVLLKTAVDNITGALTDTRTRFLGTRPVKLFKIIVQKDPALLALSSRPWIGYNYLSRYYMTPLTYDPMDYASNFSSSICTEGIVGVTGNTLRIITTDHLGDIFNQTVVQLRYSPRKMIIHPETHNLIIVESDQRILNHSEKEQFKKYVIPSDYKEASADDSQIGIPKLGAKKWASCLRLIEPTQLNTLDLIEIENDEAAISAAIIPFNTPEGEFSVLLVGTVKDWMLKPKSFSTCYIHTYIFGEQGQKLQLLHKTPVEDVPYCFTPYKGRALAGIGNSIKLYDLGKKKLLKKCEQRHFANGINSLNVMGDRIYATDISDSFHILRHKTKENQFYEFADDVLPRWISASCVLDFNTVVGADKFENIFVCRLPANVDEDIDEDPLTYKFKWETGYLNGAAFKMDQICNFYYGEMITTLIKTSLSSTSNEVILFGTSMGSIGALYPFETKEDVEFFVHLEMFLRIEAAPLAGRDHMMYRSFFGPVKNVADGDLCEQFSRLDYGKQKVLAEELDRTPAEVLKKLEDLRNRIL